MSLPRYERYKDSEVPWFVSIPEHWSVVPLRHLTTCLDGKRVPLNSEQRADRSGDIPYWGANCVMDYVDAALFDEDLVLLGEDGAPFFDRLRSVAFFSQGPVWPNNHVHVLRPSSNCVGRFLVHALNTTNYGAFIDGSTRDKLTQSAMNRIPIALPPHSEQSTIVAFLDRETAKIDGLIAEQEKLIALLAEKRKATISHAVTKGLNPNAPKRESGVVWLGDVPAHWEVRPLKWLLSDTKAGPFGSALTKDMYVSSGYRVYGQEQVIPADFSLGDYYIDEEKFLELQQYAVKPGDILISCVGTFGKIAIVPGNVEEGIINPRLLRLRVGSAINSEYLSTVLRSAVVFEQFSMVSRGGTMDVINIGTLNAITLAVPPATEQIEILDFLADQTTKLDGLSAAAEQAIVLLKERRSALIAAAVNGQIDVRDAVLDKVEHGRL